MSEFANVILSGLVNGGVYGFVALGIALIYSATRTVNFAQGTFVAVGSLLTSTLLPASGGSRWLALLAAIALGAALGWVLYALVYVRLTRLGARPFTIMIAYFAFAITIEGIALLIWGPSTLFVGAVISEEPLALGVFHTTSQRLVTIAAFWALLLGYWWVSKNTRFGMQVRATGESPSKALLVGIKPSRVVAVAFVFSGAISTLMGLLIGPVFGATYNAGVNLTVYGFIAAIIGGLGSPLAAGLGGVLLGIVQALVANYGSSLYADPIVFAILIVILLIRPYGLVGKAEA